MPQCWRDHWLSIILCVQVTQLILAPLQHALESKGAIPVLQGHNNMLSGLWLLTVFVDCVPGQRCLSSFYEIQQNQSLAHSWPGGKHKATEAGSLDALVLGGPRSDVSALTEVGSDHGNCRSGSMEIENLLWRSFLKLICFTKLLFMEWSHRLTVTGPFKVAMGEPSRLRITLSATQMVAILALKM
jgi:hypothetical protein